MDLTIAEEEEEKERKREEQEEEGKGTTSTAKRKIIQEESPLLFPQEMEDIKSADQ